MTVKCGYEHEKPCEPHMDWHVETGVPVLEDGTMLSGPELLLWFESFYRCGHDDSETFQTAEQEQKSKAAYLRALAVFCGTLA